MICGLGEQEMDGLEAKYAEIFEREHEFLEAAQTIIDAPPTTVEEMHGHLSSFFKGYTKLLSHSEKLTRLADSAQNKLMRLKHELEHQNGFIRKQHEQLVIANERLKELAITDTLTGLRNRRFLETFLEKDVENILRVYEKGMPESARNLFFMMVDLDRFKTINDTYGHHAGDMALQQFGQLVLNNCRKGDIPVRWGGEEFLVVCRDADRQYGAGLAERLRQQVDDFSFEVGSGTSLRLTCSIGFASFPFFPSDPTRVSWPDVVNLADRGLYAAKRSGRNAWVGMVSSGDIPANLPDPGDKGFLQFLHKEGSLETLSSLAAHHTLVLE